MTRAFIDIMQKVVKIGLQVKSRYITDKIIDRWNFRNLPMDRRMATIRFLDSGHLSLANYVRLFYGQLSFWKPAAVGYSVST